MADNNKNINKESKNTRLRSEKFKNEAKKRLVGRKTKKIKKKRIIIPAIAAGILIILGIFFAVQSHFYQSTDDAFIEGRMISVAPRVAGPVINLLVDDNYEVEEGQLLLEIDPNDYKVKLTQSEAKLSEAKASLGVTEKQVDEGVSNVGQSVENVNSARSKLSFAEKDYERYAEMYKDGIVSKQEYDNSLNLLTVAQADFKAANEKQTAMNAALESNKAKVEAVKAEIKRLEAEVEQAKLNLSYTKIFAPQSGMIASRSVEKGNYVQVGQPMFEIVPKRVWIVANFKENQLTNMKPGQKVMIKIDTYPAKRFKGKVDSIQRATGAKSSLFPPENAVGSNVKIVQRVPVKITFEEDISKYNIVPGMSVVPKVKVK